MRKYIDESMLEEIKTSIDIENIELLREQLFYDDINALETDGSAHILTNYFPNSNTRIVAKVFIPVNGENSHIFGARTSTSSKTFTFSRYENKCYRTHYGDSFTDFDSSIVFSQPFIIEKNKGTTILNGEYSINKETVDFTCEYPLAIFATNTKGSFSYHSVNGVVIYYLRIYKNDELLYNFIPKRNFLNEELGFYDTVNKKFYTNVGSGKFKEG